MDRRLADPDYKTSSWALYRYAPSLGAAIVFCLLFFVLTIIHAIQLWRTRTWYMIAFLIGCLFEFIGYAARCASAAQTPGYWSVSVYAVQNMYILLAPALFAASIYMVFGRVILLTEGEKYSLIRRQWLTKAFVTGDILSFLVQAGGGSLLAAMSSNASMVKVGDDIIIVGLFIQLISFAIFVVVAAIFHRRMRALPTLPATSPEIRWENYLRNLYILSTLIIIRSIFRIIENIQGSTGAIMEHEVYMYVFDSLPMLTVAAWMAWRHPSEVGLLLRGERPRPSGIELLRSKNEPEA